MACRRTPCSGPLSPGLAGRLDHRSACRPFDVRCATRWISSPSVVAALLASSDPVRLADEMESRRLRGHCAHRGSVSRRSLVPGRYPGMVALGLLLYSFQCALVGTLAYSMALDPARRGCLALRRSAGRLSAT